MARFWQEGGCRHGPWGRRPGAALCQTWPLPAVFARDLSQATAEPISQVGGTSVKTYLRKGGGNTERTFNAKGEGTQRGQGNGEEEGRTRSEDEEMLCVGTGTGLWPVDKPMPAQVHL